MRNVHRILVGKPEKKRPPVTSGRSWEDTIKVSFEGVGCYGLKWTHEAQERDRWRASVNTVMNIRVS
jgi:hypothetical protein